MTHKQPIELPKKLRAEGVIYLEMFSLMVPLYTCDRTRIDAMNFMGFDLEQSDRDLLGCVAMHADDDTGSVMFSLTIDPEATLSTWAHEAVHLADLLMEDRGIPTDASNTEVRAYITGYVVDQISEIMDGYHTRIQKRMNKKLTKDKDKTKH